MGLSGFYIPMDTVGDFLLQSQKMFLSMDGFVGWSQSIWLALLQHPVVKYGQHTPESNGSLSHTLLQGDNVSFCLSAHFLNSSRWMQTTGLKLSQ